MTYVRLSSQGLRNDFQEAMEKVDQAYLDTMFSSGHNADAEADEKKCVQEDPMETYEKIQTDAVKLGTGDLSLDMEIILKFLQVIDVLNEIITSLTKHT